MKSRTRSGRGRLILALGILNLALPVGPVLLGLAGLNLGSTFFYLGPLIISLCVVIWVLAARRTAKVEGDPIDRSERAFLWAGRSLAAIAALTWLAPLVYVAAFARLETVPFSHS